MRSRLVFLVTALLLPSTAHAELWQFWPELDVFWSMRKELRLVVIAAPTRELETGTRLDFGGGVYLDFLALHRRPFAHFTPDAGKHSRLDMRVGYARTHDASGAGVDEHRYIGQFQVRFHPVERPTYIFNRNRFELRDVEGRDLSWRYRNRTRLEDNFRWLGQNLTPYGTAEFFWDSRRDAWSRGLYVVGCEVAFPDGHLVLDLNMNLQDEWGAGETVYAPGVTLNLFF
jgi:hypothetical protein